MRLWSALLVLPIVVSLAWAQPGYESWFRDDNFLMDGLMQVSAADLKGDGRDELLLIGRDYIDRQIQLHIFDQMTTPLEPCWTSENIMEDKSPIQLMTGRFTEDGRTVAITMTNQRLDIFGWDETKGYHLLTSFEHSLFPAETAAVDWDGDGRDELLVVRVAKAGSKHYFKQPEIYRVEERELHLISVGPVLGNIRSVTAGDLDGDGRHEVIVEEGVGSRAGVFRVYSPGDTFDEWKLRWGPETLIPAPIYGMTVAKVGEENYLFAASERGRLSFVRWENGKLVSDNIMGFGAGLVSVAVGDFGEGINLALIAYPQSLRLLKRVGETSMLP